MHIMIDKRRERETEQYIPNNIKTLQIKKYNTYYIKLYVIYKTYIIYVS